MAPYSVLCPFYPRLCILPNPPGPRRKKKKEGKKKKISIELRSPNAARCSDLLDDPGSRGKRRGRKKRGRGKKKRNSAFEAPTPLYSLLTHRSRVASASSAGGGEKERGREEGGEGEHSGKLFFSSKKLFPGTKELWGGEGKKKTTKQPVFRENFLRGGGKKGREKKKGGEEKKQSRGHAPPFVFSPIFPSTWGSRMNTDSVPRKRKGKKKKKKRRKGERPYSRGSSVLKLNGTLISPSTRAWTSKGEEKRGEGGGKDSLFLARIKSPQARVPQSRPPKGKKKRERGGGGGEKGGPHLFFSFAPPPRESWKQQREGEKKKKGGGKKLIAMRRRESMFLSPL